MEPATGHRRPIYVLALIEADTLVQNLLPGLPPGPAGMVDAPLTLKQREILVLLSKGLTSKEIAQRLALSSKTVSARRSNMMKRLNLHRQSDLVAYAIQTCLRR